MGDDNMALQHRIRQRRIDKGMSATELARAADISKGYLSELENGHSPRPSGAVLMKLANALGTTIADLLEREVEPGKMKIPPSLLDFAELVELPEQDITMLARIRFRGDQPQTLEDWRFLYESIKRSIPAKNES